MVMEAGLKSREYQKFKDKEEFLGNTAISTTGLTVYLTDKVHVKDWLVLNNGANDMTYNFGVSGVNTAGTSTSGVPFIAGAERTYNDVGFDFISVQSNSGVGSLAYHAIYDTR